MKSLILLFLLSLQVFSQDNNDEFLAVIVENKEAFMSTKTGEVIFRKHAETNTSAFDTDSSGNTTYLQTKIHTVKKGETLSSIAKKRGVSIEKIKKDNKQKTTKLSIGQKLKINKRLTVESLKPTISSRETRVVARLKPGQTPSELNMPLPKDIPVNNPVVKNVKKKTIVKENVEIPVVVDQEKEGINKIIETPSYYTVKKGDTLYGIAKKHNMTIPELKKMNDLVLNNLSIGQKLKIK